MVCICEKEDFMTLKITQAPCSWKMRYVPLGCFRNWPGCAYGRLWGIKSKLILKFFISIKSISVAACLHKTPQEVVSPGFLSVGSVTQASCIETSVAVVQNSTLLPNFEVDLPSPMWYQFCIYVKFKNYSVLETFIEIAKEAMQCETV